MLLVLLSVLVQGLTGLFNFIDLSTSDIAAWVGGWSVYRDLQKEIAATSESNAAAIKTETDQLNALYKSLINTTAGTDGRKKAIEALQAKYGDTINLQNLENAGLGEIAKSQQKAIKGCCNCTHFSFILMINNKIYVFKDTPPK